jgi:hypothetical protein
LVQADPIRVKLSDQQIDALDLCRVTGRTQQLAVALNLFVYFYARLTHGANARYFTLSIATDALGFAKRDHLTISKGTGMERGQYRISKEEQAGQG